MVGIFSNFQMTRIFSFSNQTFYSFKTQVPLFQPLFNGMSYIFQILVKDMLVWSKFNPFPNKPWFLCVCRTSLLKTLWVKEKLLVTGNFSFFHSVFYPFGELFAIFIKFEFVVCKLFQFGKI